MSDDLVKRLQTNGDVLRHIETQADFIKAQKARIAELEAALRKISAWHPLIQTLAHRRIDQLRNIAKAALEGKGNA